MRGGDDAKDGGTSEAVNPHCFHESCAATVQAMRKFFTSSRLANIAICEAQQFQCVANTNESSLGPEYSGANRLSPSYASRLRN